jgi:hypothetical protein
MTFLVRQHTFSITVGQLFYASISISVVSAAIESFFKGLEILHELEEKTGYLYPLSDAIQEYISKLKRERRIAN